MAVPAPSSTAATAQTGKVAATAMTPSATAWSHMPAAIIHLRPHRSDRAPVTSCPTPQTAGYSAARTPILLTDMPTDANRIGKRPHARPSLRLFTRPAWLADDS